MLKKQNRLSVPRLSNPKNVHTPLFSLKVSANSLTYPRFAFVISKKIDKRATKRNFLKRKFSSCVEEIFDRIEGGFDFVFYPSVKSLTEPKEKLEEEIKKILIKHD